MIFEKSTSRLPGFTRSELVMRTHTEMRMDPDSIPLLAFPIGTKAEEDAVRRKQASKQKAAQNQNAKAKRSADANMEKNVHRASEKAEKQIRDIRENDRKRALLEERAKRGPPRGATKGGKWVWKTFSEPSTLLFCIPWSKRVEKLVYRARDGTFWSD